MIADAVRTLLHDKDMAEDYTEAVAGYVKETSWYATADKLYELYRSLI